MKRHLSLVLLLLAAVLIAPAPAGAASCSGTSGVTVVVRFADRTETRCAAGDPGSGYDALKVAGFALTYAQGSGAGALCRIDGAPGNVNCGAMPPANNYWSYWHAKPGGSWTYSTTGGGGYDPAPGSVEGWVLGDGKSAPSAKAPSATAPVTPKPTRTPSSKPKPTPKPAAQTSAPNSPNASAAPDAPASPGTAAAGTTTPTVPTASASDLPATAATDAATDAPSDAATDAATDAAAAPASGELTQPSSGGASWIWGVVLVGVLGLAALAEALRRRRS